MTAVPSDRSSRAAARTQRRRIAGALSISLSVALGAGMLALSGSSAHALDGLSTIQAEGFASQAGAVVEHTIDVGAGQDVGWLAAGDWMRYSDVNLGTPGTLATSVRVASASAVRGTLELRADSLSGPVLGTFAIPATGSWQTWVTLSATTSSALNGKHDVFVTLQSAQTADFVNLNWFTVAGSGASATPDPTATPSPTMSMPGGTQTGSWTSVDPVKQATDARAFFARSPKTPPAGTVKVAEFNAACTVSHHAPDDPIVFFGQPGASHNHAFIGNTSTNANSTLASLLAGTTNCSPKLDKSAYWVPALYAKGRLVDPEGITVYYGSRLADPSKTQPFPAGFRMITGDAKMQVDTPDKQGNHFWCAGIGGEVGRTADGLWPICAPTAQLTRQVTFADCWDGVHLDSPDHKSHVSNQVAGTCPAAFPVAIPNISFVMSWPLGMDTSDIRLASGSGFSMHADFLNAWDPDALAQRVRDCLDQGVKCNSAGGF